jgi:hypothetical protein
MREEDSMTAVASSTSTGKGALAAPKPQRSLIFSLALALAACSGSIDGDHGPGGSNPGTNGQPGPGGNGQAPGGNGQTPGGNGGNMMGGGGPGNQPGTMPGSMTPAESFPPVAGHTPMRRLTRTQYNNTIQDLLGITGDTAGEFGIDEVEAGFAANNSAPLKELQIEKYQQVAADLAEKAVANLANLVKCTGMDDAACAEGFIRNFGKRAYRRPLTDAEVTRYKALFETGKTGGNLGSGIELVLTAMLQSPNFLYRIELGDPATASKDGVALTPYEVGTRLSYFLTNSTPDDGLLAAADAGKLKTPEGIAAEAQRLIASPKAQSTLSSFFEQWLQIDDLLTVEKDMKAYPIFTPDVRAAMHDEVLELVDQVARQGDGKLETLLTSNSSYFRGPLYPIYGLGMASNAGGSILKKIDLPAAERSGLFTTAAVLSKHGHADQSSPVGRGNLLSDRLLCLVVPDPPPGVDNNVPAADPNVSTRVRFEQHRKDPSCAACHALMDPLGVTFENYDGIGRFRTMDGGKAVDSSSELKGTKGSDGPVKNAVELLHKLATAAEVKECFTKQMFRYAFGRAEQMQDTQTISDGLGALAKSGRIPDLMVAITTSPGFRNRLPVDLR